MCYTIEVGVLHVDMLCCDVLHCRSWCVTCKDVFGVVCYTVEVGVSHVKTCLVWCVSGR